MDDLPAGERVIFEGHPSWRSILAYYLKGLVFAVVLGALAALVTRIAQDEINWALLLGIVVLVLALVVLGGFVQRISTTYVVTTKRLWIRRGILSRAVQETRLERVQNVNTRQTFFERLLRVGTVDFDTAGTDDSDFTFRGIDDPEGVARAVDRATHGEAHPVPTA